MECANLLLDSPYSDLLLERQLVGRPSRRIVPGEGPPGRTLHSISYWHLAAFESTPSLAETLSPNRPMRKLDGIEGPSNVLD